MTVCEPAMGSAAFLNEAISQLAEAYLDKKQEELGEQIAFDKRAAELQRVKMFIADRNVYGVDLNPIAVELAEVSLWLNTIYKGAHVPWFGTQLACGNSLVGARRQVYNALKLKKGTWYNEEPEKVPEEWVTDRSTHETRKIYKRKRSGGSYIYHFLLGDPGMANYTDKVIKELEPDNIKHIKQWQKDFCAKYSDEDIEILNKLSDIVDDLWMRTIYARQRVEIRTEDSLSVYGHDEGTYEEHLTIREKDTIYQNIYKSIGGENASPYARLKAAMDYWCALWFWPIDKADMLPTRQEFFMELSLILEGGISATVKKNVGVGQMSLLTDENNEILGFGTDGSELANEVQAQINGLGVVNLEQIRGLYPRLQIADDIAKKQRFMHWELEFADLFYERGGFDLVIGNPPWIKVTWEEFGVLSEKNPGFAIKDFTANDTKEHRHEVLENPLFEQDYISEYVSTSAQQNYLNSVQNYAVLKGQQTNLYKCFLPLSTYVANKDGVFAFVHPNSIFDDPKGGLLRKEYLPKVRYHFHFWNEFNLFDILHTASFSLNIYSNYNGEYFDCISNLYTPSTVDMCYESDGSGIAKGLKEDNEWIIEGHKDRIIRIGKDELLTFAKVFDGNNQYETARIPVLHVVQYYDVLKCFSEATRVLNDLGDGLFCSEMIHETNSQKSGLIVHSEHFPEHGGDLILSGPHIGAANPLYKASREVCRKLSDYDSIDLNDIDENYYQRCNYIVGVSEEEFNQTIPMTPWGDSYRKGFRLVSRKMLYSRGEHTLISAIIPPSVCHINGIFGIAFKNERDLLNAAGMFFSLPSDFLIKVTGSANLGSNNALKIPMYQGELSNYMIHRVLKLECITRAYTSLWKNNYSEDFMQDSWGKKDERLSDSFINQDTDEWSVKQVARNEYIRRQLLVEIDVLASMMLGITLEQLKSIYRIQFSVLLQNEKDTWYDRNGRIVFTSNKGINNFGYSREEWESIKEAKDGVFKRTVTDDTMPGGPVVRTIEYVAPFDRCDREKDYEEVWHNFEERFRRC